MGVAFLVIALHSVPVLLCAAATASLALVIRMLRSKSPPSNWLYGVAGTVMPLMMATFGQYLAWPWPWARPESLHDGFPPGPILLFVALPSWLICLLTAKLILERKPLSPNRTKVVHE